MGVGLRLWLCFFFGIAIICSASARNTISLSVSEEEEMGVALEDMEGRSLSGRVKLDDYSEASANRGHDPRTRGGGVAASRKTRDNP